MKVTKAAGYGILLSAILHALRIILPTALPATAGFSPIGAAALFAGAMLPTTGAALLTTLGGMLASDLFILFAVYGGKHGFPVYGGWPWVYGSFLLMTLAGRLLARVGMTPSRACLFAVGSCVAHWLITNTGVWLGHGINLRTGAPYSADLSGYADCLAQAIPYNLRFLAGTVGFGALALAAHRFAVNHTAAARESSRVDA